MFYQILYSINLANFEDENRYESELSGIPPGQKLKISPKIP